MAVINDNQTVSSNVNGFSKKIDSSAATMMLDNLQTYMYQKPFHSCVRECSSNAIDAVKEKEMARLILSGEAKVDDYYVEKEIKEGESNIYADSKFNPEYYDLNWLGTDNTVKLTYFNNEQTQRDLFTIEDPGVGLGGKRLEGFFNLGYSSKRLNHKELGGFGLGAKSPLATGVESYRMITRYNGKEFCFDIYSHKVDCVYARWNEDGTENPSVQFEGSRFKAFYKPTTLKNGTTIQVEVKKHNKQQYFEAVRSQLMYLKDDIEFWETYHDGRAPYNVPFKADILYEDKDVVLSSSNNYTKPHFVIKNVGYGLIDFNELELSTRFGNIGIKVAMEDIEVVPSRESVVYSQKTKDAVLAVYDRVTNTVTDRINGALDQDSILPWIRACNRVMFSSSNSSDELSRLSQLIDKSQLKPVFKKGEYTFTSDLGSFTTPLLRTEFVHLTSKWNAEKRKNITRITRDTGDNIRLFDKPVYLQFVAGDARTSSYLMTSAKDTGFCCIRVATAYDYLQDTFLKLQKGTITPSAATVEAHKLVAENEKDSSKVKIIHQSLNKAIKLITLMKDDPFIESYDEVQVPENFTMHSDGDEVSDSDLEKMDEEKRKLEQREREKRRRENKIFIGNKIGVRNPKGTYVDGFYREEIKYADLDTDTCQLVYGTETEDDLFRVMLNAKKYSPERTSKDSTFYWDEDVKVLKVAKSNLRYVKQDGLPVQDFIFEVDDEGTLSTFKELRRSFTAQLVEQTLGEGGDFLSNFGEFDLELSTTFRKLRDYVEKSTSLDMVISEEPSNSILQDLRKAYTVNVEMVKSEKPKTQEEFDKLLEAAKLTTGKKIQTLNLIDEELYKEAVWVKNFTDVYGRILNYIDPLCDDEIKILDPELVTEIKMILRLKKDQLEGVYPGISSI